MLVEGLHEYEKVKRDEDARLFLNPDTWHDTVTKFYKSDLYGLADPDPYRIVAWLLLRRTHKLGYNFVKGPYGADSYCTAVWFEITVNPDAVTRAKVMTVMFGEREETSEVFAYDRKRERVCPDCDNNNKRRRREGGGSMLRALERANHRSERPPTKWGEADVHNDKTLDEAREEAAMHRQRMNLDLPDGALSVPDVDVDDDDALPPAPAEQPLGQPVEPAHMDNRGGEALQEWIQEKGYRRLFEARFNAEERLRDVLRRRQEHHDRQLARSARSQAGPREGDDDNIGVVRSRSVRVQDPGAEED